MSLNKVSAAHVGISPSLRLLFAAWHDTGLPGLLPALPGGTILGGGGNSGHGGCHGLLLFANPIVHRGGSGGRRRPGDCLNLLTLDEVSAAHVAVGRPLRLLGTAGDGALGPVGRFFQRRLAGLRQGDDSPLLEEAFAAHVIVATALRLLGASGRDAHGLLPVGEFEGGDLDRVGVFFVGRHCSVLRSSRWTVAGFKRSTGIDVCTAGICYSYG
mmetsp:Transcript_20733/g.46260  ORF Transcript_20733/g.46260 Transcript_20733/m.46260 type:complete len:214 (-) Transcript_20733:12-653(-)